MSTAPSDFLSLPDLAARSAGGAVLWANDDLFAERENLINPAPPEHRPSAFGHKGQIYDGWETRRRRPIDGGAAADSHDFAIIRLAAAGIVRGVVVDTGWFTGNYPPQISVEAAFVTGYPSAKELVEKTQWTTIVERSDVTGDTRNPFKVSSSRRWTHLRLSIYPDGGVARLRVHGEGLLDPRFADGLPMDLAALTNGGRITSCSNMNYSSPNNLLLPETTGCTFIWPARVCSPPPSWIPRTSSAIRRPRPDYPGATTRDPDGEWFELLGRTELQPDTRHRFLIDSDRAVTEARLDIYPDGGMARLRLFGRLTADGLRRSRENWETSG